MVGNSISEVRPGGAHRSFRIGTVLLAFWITALSARAMLQFDVFLGYEGVVPEACWFPVVCEIKNDGPSFTGVVEVTPGNYNQGQTRRLVVELPTGTLKRIVIPVFSTSRGYSRWDVRLLDERGKVRAEQVGMQAQKQTPIEAPLIGALPRTAGGTPTVRPILAQQSQSEWQPVAARLQPTIFPDNPLVLEGMDSLYLNSEKATELRVSQAKALYAWLHAGGHLIVGVEQVQDINSVPWLKELFPMEVTGITTLARHTELQEWLRSASVPARVLARAQAGSSPPPRVRYGPNAPRPRPGQPPPAPVPPAAESGADASPFSTLGDDFAFESAPLQVATGKLLDGQAVVSSPTGPLIVTAARGRGRITALLFSPEREPVRSWKHLPTFWARVTDVPLAWYAAPDFARQGGWSSDGVFGAMIDSKQVHKLPIEWLLLLLVVYLLVIGPFDQFWLKRIGKPMLTWITFPCYVVLFSLLIYFIGYKLRAGESEWNELHLVDVLLNGDRAELRGRTYASIYSPANQKYTLESQQKYATLRSEFVGSWGGGQPSDKGTVMQVGDSFRAELFVPVWTSQLFVSDWWQSASVPLNVTVTPTESKWRVQVVNRTDRKLTSAQLAIEDSLIPLGDIGPSETKTFTVSKEQGMRVRDFASRYGATFQTAVQSRQHAFGATESGRIGDLPNSSIAASFISQIARQNNLNFLAPPGLDLSPVIEHGGAVLFAWAADYSPIKPLNQFAPRRLHRDTLWRVAVTR